MVARPETGSIPDAPGSYQFFDAEGRVIYVGKAKSLRSRLSNYFLQPYLLPERTRQMVQAAERVEWIVAGKPTVPRSRWPRETVNSTAGWSSNRSRR